MSKWIQFTDVMINLDQVIMATKGEQRVVNTGPDSKAYSITFWFSVQESTEDPGGIPYRVEEEWPDEKSRDLAWADIHEAAGVAFDLDRHVGE